MAPPSYALCKSGALKTDMMTIQKQHTPIYCGAGSAQITGFWSFLCTICGSIITPKFPLLLKQKQNNYFLRHFWFTAMQSVQLNHRWNYSHSSWKSGRELSWPQKSRRKPVDSIHKVGKVFHDGKVKVQLLALQGSDLRLQGHRHFWRLSEESEVTKDKWENMKDGCQHSL